MRVQVEISRKKMFERLKTLDEYSQRSVKKVIRDTTLELAGDAKIMLSKRVTYNKRARRHIRSRPGQAPRFETGRFWRGLKYKFSPKGWVGYVTTDNTAADKKGRRYPWMLESGTKTIKKRPLFKRLQRQKFKAYRLRVGRAMIDAIRRSR
jgi:hypothetical protein